MFKKVIALATTAGIVGALAFGCSSSTSDTASDDAGTKCKKGQTLTKGKCVAAKSTDDVGTDSTGTDSTGTTTKDSGVTSTKDAAGVCSYNATAAGAYKAVTSPATAAKKAGACDAAKIAEYKSKCLSSAVADGGAAACTAFLATTCGQCIEVPALADGGAAPRGPFYTSGGKKAANQLGCIDVVSAIPNCGDTYNNTVSCIFDSACVDCADADQQACINEALATGAPCAAFGGDGTCITAATDSKGPVVAACFPASSSAADQDAFITNMISAFCL